MRKAARKAREGALNHAVARKLPKHDESHYNKDSCDMRRVTEAEFFGPKEEKQTARGWFFWKDIVRDGGRCRGIFARYPDGSAVHLPVRPVPTELQNVNAGHSWGWDGNEDHPTLTPSVRITGCWHGWVKKGRMVSC